MLLFPFPFGSRLGIGPRNVLPSFSRLHREYDRAPRGAAGPYPPDLSPVQDLRGFTRVPLRTPSGLACRTRHAWQYRAVPALSGLLSILTGVPRLGLPSASTRPLRRPGGRGLAPPLGHMAPRGAPSRSYATGEPGNPRTHAAARCRRSARGKSPPASSSSCSSWSENSSARPRSVTASGRSSSFACISVGYPPLRDRRTAATEPISN